MRLSKRSRHVYSNSEFEPHWNSVNLNGRTASEFSLAIVLTVISEWGNARAEVRVFLRAGRAM